MKEKVHLMFFEIMNDARDAQLTKGAQQSLLYHLILRCDPKKDYSCFPSFELLCADTGLDMTTVKRAARELTKKGLISRVVRPNRSNLWYVNVKLLQEAAGSKRSARADDKAAKQSCPFEPPVIRKQPDAFPALETSTDTGTAGTPGLLAGDAELSKASTPEEQVLVEKIHAMLKKRLGAHPTYDDPNVENILGSCIDECIAHAGSAKRCKAILSHTLKDDDTLDYLSKSRYLGGCLKKCFPGWVAEYNELQMGECQEDLLKICHGVELETVATGNVFCDTFTAYIHETLGEHLLHFEAVQVGKDTRFMVEVTDAAKLAHILGAHSGQLIEIASVPDFVDSSVVAQLQAAITNEPWASALAESNEPLEYFIDHLHQIADEVIDREPLEAEFGADSL